jgi:hypothetical protein
MLRKQPLLLIVMIMVFGVAVAGAIWIFGVRNIQMRRDHIVADINRLAADAFQYRLRPASMGGGGGSYAHYSIPEKLRVTPLAAYEISQTSSPETLIILAVAARDLGTITASVDPGGMVRITARTGELDE